MVAVVSSKEVSGKRHPTDALVSSNWALTRFSREKNQTNKSSSSLQQDPICAPLTEQEGTGAQPVAYKNVSLLEWIDLVSKNTKLVLLTQVTSLEFSLSSVWPHPTFGNLFYTISLGRILLRFFWFSFLSYNSFLFLLFFFLERAKMCLNVNYTLHESK